MMSVDDVSLSVAEHLVLSEGGESGAVVAGASRGRQDVVREEPTSAAFTLPVVQVFARSRRYL